MRLTVRGRLVGRRRICLVTTHETAMFSRANSLIRAKPAMRRAAPGKQLGGSRMPEHKNGLAVAECLGRVAIRLPRRA